MKYNEPSSNTNCEADGQHYGDMILDTSKMSQGKRDALEIAEAARQRGWDHPSLAGSLFMGRFMAGLVSPFPEQPEQDAKIGDEFIEKLSRYLSAHLDADEVDASRTIPEEVIRELFKMGVFGMKVPKEYGGLGFSQTNYNRAMMAIASYCGATAVLVSAHQSIGVPQPLSMFGTQEQKEKYFPRLREKSISAFALTERAVGSDPARMSTEAVPIADGKYYMLNGEKQWCTNGPIADLFVVMAKTPPKVVNGRERSQITAFILERATPGVEVIYRCDFMGLSGMQNGCIKFTNVRIPAENIIGGLGKGLKVALSTLNIGRLTLPAACTGTAKQCLSIARRFGKSRIQWGQPIGRHEAGQEKLAFIASTTLAMEAVTLLTSRYADLKNVDIRLEAAMAKLFCSENGWKIVDATMQLRGGRGYETALSLKARGEDAYPVERMVRDARINLIIEGTSEVIKLFLAREALDPHLTLAAGLLKKNAPFTDKMASALKMIGFYASWYPRQWINQAVGGGLFIRYSQLGPLAHHYRFIERTSHRMARTIFHLMCRHQDKLEQKQMLLSHIMEIGTELFAMAATCSFATLKATKLQDSTPLALADLFCRQSIRRIKAHFRALRCNDNPRINNVAGQVLDGQMRWLEEGVIWIGPNE